MSPNQSYRGPHSAPGLGHASAMVDSTLRNKQMRARSLP
jgi:hypothetical protein